MALKTFAVTYVFSVPSNITAFSPGLGLNPEPEMVTVVPDTPVDGLRPKIFTLSPGPEGISATANIEKWLTSADAARPDGLMSATNSLRSYWPDEGCKVNIGKTELGGSGESSGNVILTGIRKLAPSGKASTAPAILSPDDGVGRSEGLTDFISTTVSALNA